MSSFHHPTVTRGLDRVGVLASSLCLVHCLAMPLVVATAPLFASERIEGRARRGPATLRAAAAVRPRRGRARRAGDRRFCARQPARDARHDTRGGADDRHAPGLARGRAVRRAAVLAGGLRRSASSPVVSAVALKRASRMSVLRRRELGEKRPTFLRSPGNFAARASGRRSPTSPAWTRPAQVFADRRGAPDGLAFG